MTYTLSINVDANGVSQINASGQYVTLLQNVTSQVQSSSPAGRNPTPELLGSPALSIVWAAFSPFQTNLITWPGSYFLYASPATPESGTVIGTNATVAAQQGWIYPLTKSLVFGAPTAGPGDGYLAANRTSVAMSFGLAAPPTINSVPQAMAAMNATEVLPSEVAMFTPDCSVMVLLSSYGTAGTVFELFTTPLVVSMSSTIASVSYNDATGAFHLSG
jgi:hypothetical protein